MVVRDLGVDELCDWGKLQEVSLEGRGMNSGISCLGGAVLPSVWGTLAGVPWALVMDSWGQGQTVDSGYAGRILSSLITMEFSEFLRD